MCVRRDRRKPRAGVLRKIPQNRVFSVLTEPAFVYIAGGFCYKSGVGLFIIVYLTAVALAALTVGWAASLAKKSGQRLFRSFFYFVVVNDLFALLDILFRYLPSRVGSPAGGVGSMVAGFLVFPLMAAFSVLVIDFMLALDGRPFPGPLKKICAGYWGLLFLGFLVAEFRQIDVDEVREHLHRVVRDPGDGEEEDGGEAAEEGQDLGRQVDLELGMG